MRSWELDATLAEQRFHELFDGLLTVETHRVVVRLNSNRLFSACGGQIPVGLGEKFS